MKKKILLGLFIFVLVLSFTTGCNKEEKETDKEKESLASDSYTTLNVWGVDLKFKQHKETSYWDCDDNFGAGEIDTVYLVSEDGKKVENYYDMENTSGIIFQTGDDIDRSVSSLVNSYKKWDNIDVEVKDINDGIYKRHIIGESNDLYFEAYFFKINGNFEGEEFEVNYKLELRIYKEDYSREVVEKAIEEYHTIIDTLVVE